MQTRGAHKPCGRVLAPTCRRLQAGGVDKGQRDTVDLAPHHLHPAGLAVARRLGAAQQGVDGGALAHAAEAQHHDGAPKVQAGLVQHLGALGVCRGRASGCVGGVWVAVWRPAVHRSRFVPRPLDEHTPAQLVLGEDRSKCWLHRPPMHCFIPKHAAHQPAPAPPRRAAPQQRSPGGCAPPCPAGTSSAASLRRASGTAGSKQQGGRTASDGQGGQPGAQAQLQRSTAPVAWGHGLCVGVRDNLLRLCGRPRSCQAATQLVPRGLPSPTDPSPHPHAQRDAVDVGAELLHCQLHLADLPGESDAG